MYLLGTRSFPHSLLTVLASSLVQESVSLEDKLECHGITHEVLDDNSVCGRGMTRLIVKTGWEKCFRDAENHQSTAVAADIASSTSWLKLWDMALDHGHQGDCLSASTVLGTN